MKEKIEKWLHNFVEFNKVWAPYLIAANIGTGIMGLFMGFWASGLFNLFAAYAMYFVYYKLNNEN